MTRIILLKRLQAFTEEVTADLIMPTRLQKGDTEQSFRPAKVYLMRLPDGTSATKKAPYVLHQVITGMDQQPQGQRVTSSAKVRSICCVYNDDEQEGGLMLLNLMERLRIAMLRQVVIGGQFTLDLEAGLETLVYNKVKASTVTASDIASAMENVELCLTLLGIVPDLLCAPGYSQQSTVAAAMTAKAGNINGLFRAKALIDIDCGASGARAYSDVLTKKNAANIADEDEIAFWPMAKLGDYKFHLSTQMAGLMAQIDTGNGGCPYESPSNKGLQCDGLCLEDGTEVNLTLAQANYLNGIGVDTALNFMSGWVAWGNYTACYPSNTDVKDYFIPVSRMFGWVGNSLVKTFWSKLDKPMTHRLIDTVLDSANIWLNGLVGMGYLLGARVEMLENENPLTNLMAGIIKLHVYMTPPSPAQEIDFVLEYDASYVTSALQG